LYIFTITFSLLGSIDITCPSLSLMVAVTFRAPPAEMAPALRAALLSVVFRALVAVDAPTTVSTKNLQLERRQSVV
jgi:hypothetical protein